MLPSLDLEFQKRCQKVTRWRTLVAANSFLKSSQFLVIDCDGFKETSRNLEVFFIKVAKNERRTYLKNFIAVSISNGHKTKLNPNFVLALSLS